jgi:hypothetical protein
MTHKWDYEHPINLWESMPFWIRWPVGVAAICYFGGGFLIGILLMLR